MPIEVLYPRCAGLDVHKDTVVARIRCVSSPVANETRSFGTMTGQLLELRAWLLSHGVTHVAMEATGIYWKPVWHVLEDNFELILANAQHIRNVPGRKTDVNDASWIADLLAHGLIRGSFVPPAPVQELRDLTRTRKQLVREMAEHVQRIHKVLHDANIKLASVLSDIMGVTGRAILAAVIQGESDPIRLAALAQGTARKKHTELVEALRGRVTIHHRKLLKLHLDLIDAIEGSIKELDDSLGKAPAPLSEAIELLKTIPGVGNTTAQVIIAEIGADMTRFETSGNLISWACLCPRNDESAGKRRSTRVRNGGTWLKTGLVTAAWAAVRKKGSYLQAQFFRLKSRQGPKKAILAVASSMLTSAYFMLRKGQPYQDLGANHFQQRDTTKAVQRLAKRIADMGWEVQLQRAS